MAITTEIDLTLESDFAGEYDKWLRPDRVRERERCELFPKAMIPISVMLACISHSAFFYDDNKYKLLDYFLNFYYELFGMSPKLLSRWGEMDPYAPYFFGAGIFCDCCGTELNILNNDHFLCNRCHSRNPSKTFKLN